MRIPACACACGGWAVHKISIMTQEREHIVELKSGRPICIKTPRGTTVSSTKRVDEKRREEKRGEDEDEDEEWTKNKGTNAKYTVGTPSSRMRRRISGARRCEVRSARAHTNPQRSVSHSGRTSALRTHFVNRVRLPRLRANSISTWTRRLNASAR